MKPSSRSPLRRWLPVSGVRERTATTALMLLFVVATVHAAPGWRLPAPELLTEVQATESTGVRVAPAGTWRAESTGGPVIARASAHRPCRSISRAELPPVRAPARV